MTKSYLQLFAATCLWLGNSGQAFASPLDALHLRVDGVASCPADEHSVRSEAERLLPAAGHYDPMDILLVVTEHGAGYRVQLTAHSGEREAERSVDVEDCDHTRQALALLVALTVDPEAAGTAAPTAEPKAAVDSTDAKQGPQSTAPPEPAASPKPQDATDRDKPDGSSVAAQTRSSTLGWSLGARAIGDSAVLPQVALGPGLLVIAQIHGFSAAVTGSWLLTSESTVPGHPNARVDGQLWSAGLEACQVLFLEQAFSAGPCVMLEGGAYAASSAGVTHPGDDRTLWLAGSMSVLGSVALAEAFALDASVGLLVPVTRPVLSFRDIGAAHTVPLASLRVALGLRWRIGGKRH